MQLQQGRVNDVHHRSQILAGLVSLFVFPMLALRCHQLVPRQARLMARLMSPAVTHPGQDDWHDCRSPGLGAIFMNHDQTQ